MISWESPAFRTHEIFVKPLMPCPFLLALNFPYAIYYRTEATAYEIYENKMHTNYSGFTVYAARCSNIGSLTYLQLQLLHASNDIGDLISLHQAECLQVSLALAFHSLWHVHTALYCRNFFFFTAGTGDHRHLVSKASRLEKTSEKALTDNSKFVFGLTFWPLFQRLPQRIWEAISGPTVINNVGPEIASQILWGRPWNKGRNVRPKTNLLLSVSAFSIIFVFNNGVYSLLFRAKASGEHSKARALNPRCAVPAESHSFCTDRRWPCPAAAQQVSPTSDTCQSVAILMNRPHCHALCFC